MNNCVMCGSPIPKDQGSRTCSMCYGDVAHGKDGYYQQWMEEQQRKHEADEMKRYEYEQEMRRDAFGDF